MKKSFLAFSTAVLIYVLNPSMSVAEVSYSEETDNSYSVVEISQGESITIPHGYDIGIIEQDSPQSYGFRSANTAPSCVEAKVEKLAVQVYNRCGSDMRVKVIMTANTAPFLGAKDTACKTIAAGTKVNVRWVIRGNEKVDRVENC